MAHCNYDGPIGSHGEKPRRKPAKGIPMWLVRHDGDVYVAYPKAVQAKVYATNFARETNVEIVEGVFVAKKAKKVKP